MARCHVDRADAGADMRVGQKLVEADIDEQRIAVAIFAVGAGRLQDLGDEVHVVGAVVLQAFKPARRLDHAQRLGQHRALAPRPAGEDLEVAPAHLDRLLVAAVEVGEVVARQLAAVLLVVAARSSRRCRRHRTPRAPPAGRPAVRASPRRAPGRPCIAACRRGRSAGSGRRPWAPCRRAGRSPRSTATSGSRLSYSLIMVAMYSNTAKPSLA